MMWRFAPYIVGVVVLIGSVLSGVAYVNNLKSTIETQKTRLQTQELLIGACNSRIKSITEKKKADAEVDSIPDSDLPFVPDRWMQY